MQTGMSRRRTSGMLGNLCDHPRVQMGVWSRPLVRSVECSGAQVRGFNTVICNEEKKHKTDARIEFNTLLDADNPNEVCSVDQDVERLESTNQ